MMPTLLVSISHSFNSFDNLSWTATIYIIGVSASQLLAGHLTDLFGRREGMVLCSTIFAVGCLICGLSKNLPVLLVGRAIQGFGGGAMGLITAIIEGDLVPLRNRGVTEALGGIVFGAGLATGGLWGGGINDALAWRWAFLIQVPVIAACIVAVYYLLDIPRKQWDFSTLKRVDYIGCITLLTAVVLLQIGIDSGGNTLPWMSPVVLVSLPLALASFLGFIFWNLTYAIEPVIPLRLFANRNVAAACLACFLQLCSHFSNLFYIPIYLQVLGYSTTQTGLRFIPQALGAAVGTFIAGIIVKRTGRYYYLNVVAQALFVLGCALLNTLNLDTPPWPPFIFLTLTGLGFGLSWISLLMGLLSSISNTQQGTAQSASWSLRTLGMVIGLAISSATFQKVLKANLETNLGGLKNSNSLIESIRTNFANLRTLEPAIRYLAEKSYMRALHVVFYITTGEIALSAMVSFFITENEIPENLK
jgi:EmrB/QacA subfamily drug resistance transporter